MIERFEEWEPQIDPEAFVHEAARIIGEVRIGAQASVWPGAVLRGDEGLIVVGARTSIQDNCVLHATGGRSQTLLGERVTVGHGVILHGCRVADDCIVGMGSVLMDDVEIGPWSIVGAGSLVPPGKKFPPGVLILGRPGRVAREVTDAERTWITYSSEEYLSLVRRHQATRLGSPRP